MFRVNGKMITTGFSDGESIGFNVDSYIRHTIKMVDGHTKVVIYLEEGHSVSFSRKKPGDFLALYREDLERAMAQASGEYKIG